jgi:hypothetical protein
MKRAFLLLLAFVAFRQASASTIVFDQGFQGTAEDNQNISSQLVADDFYLNQASAVTEVLAWFGEGGPVNGVLDNFNGTLGWAIFSDAAGVPGSLLYSGQDTSPVVQTTGTTNTYNEELFTIDASLTGIGTLPTGTYWLSLRNGAWGSPATSGTLGWSSYFYGAGGQNLSLVNYSTSFGTTNPLWIASQDPIENTPGVGYYGTDMFFTLKGVAVPEPSAAVMLGLGLGGSFVMARRRRK